MRNKKLRVFKNVFLLFISIGFFVFGGIVLWATTIQIPDIASIQTWRMTESTKILDRTENVLLYDVHQSTKRTIVPLTEISTYATRATIAIEDERFYEHHGIDLRAIARMIWVDITKKSLSQGGSTITQQVAKNAFLSPEKTITRKLKEWVIAIKMEQVMSKDKILELYFNEVPYGGSVYGIEEASLMFYGKHAKDLTLAESAYLAAIPKAPTYYSPFGNNRDKLETRKNLVLQKMLEQKLITQAEYDKARQEKVVFQRNATESITAPHFVFMVKQYLEDKYGSDMVENGGLKVVTTLDADLQVKAEGYVQQFGATNVTQYNAHNAAAVAIDPKTGQVLALVGSRDYFDKSIQGNFNVAISPNRQPGSSFKPFVYATAFAKGYTPDTILYDVPTEFNASCTPEGVPKDATTKPEECYMPTNYDNKWEGPMTLRNALAQSVNIPAVKLSYLAGVDDSITTARKMGVTTLGKASSYGLTLVLGSGQVSLYEMTGAYGVFANEGDRNPNAFILRIEDSAGKVLEEYEPQTEHQVISSSVADQITDILADNVARAPLYDMNSPLYFPGRQVAVKTGTTNDYRDAWIIGYTPSFVLGVWAGNNDNTPMEKKISGFIVAPMWNAIMNEELKKLPVETFNPLTPTDPNLKPVLRGVALGHTILNYVDKSDPQGPMPANPSYDSQYWLWETPVVRWANQNGAVVFAGPAVTHTYVAPAAPDVRPSVSFSSPSSSMTYSPNKKVVIEVNASGKFPMAKAELYVNGKLYITSPMEPFSFYFIPRDVSGIQAQNELRAVVTDTQGNKGEATTQLNVGQ